MTKSLYARKFPVLLYICIFSWCQSCTSSKPLMVLPETFTAEATRMPVQGIGKGGSQTKKLIQFGGYATSRIQRGWNTTTSRYAKGPGMTVERIILKNLGVEEKDFTTTRNDKFQFTIQGEDLHAEVYGFEREVTAQTRYENPTRFPGDIDVLKNATYSFSAAMFTNLEDGLKEWQLIIYAVKDPRKKAGQNFIERMEWEETGYLTNVKDTIVVQAVKVDKIQSASGKITEMPFAVMKAYEFRRGQEVSAIVDIFGQVIWMSKQLDKKTEFIIASASSAILLRRIGMF